MEPISITLTRDELLVFLAIIGTSTMNGLDDDPLAGVSEREIAERMNSGEQSLLNRELITFEGQDNLVLDDVLVALAGGAVIPDATFLLTESGADGSVDPHYFSATPEVLVEHDSPRPGVFVFKHLEDPDALTRSVQMLLAPLHPLPEPESNARYQIPATAFSKSMELGRKGKVAAAQKGLVKAGLPADVSSALAEDLKTSTMWVGMAAWGLREEQPEGGDSVVAVMGSGRCWLVENVDGKPDDVTIRRASGTDCENHFVALLEPLQKTLVSST